MLFSTEIRERSRTSAHKGYPVPEKMKDLGNYECDGQIEMTDYLKSQIKCGSVKDLTAWINSQGKAQYVQIGEVVKKSFDDYKDDPDFVDRLTNNISVYVLEQSVGYMKYLKGESGVAVDD